MSGSAVRLFACALLAVACRRASEPTPAPTSEPPAPGPAVAPRVDAAPFPDAPVELVDAPPIDAARAVHRLLALSGDDAGALGAEIRAPGLPAFDPASKTILVAYQAHYHMSAFSELELRILRAADARLVSTIPVWTMKEAQAVVGEPTTDQDLRKLGTTIDARLALVEQPLARFTTMPECLGTDPVAPDADGDGEPDMPTEFSPGCDGHTLWTCGDVVLEYPHRPGWTAVTTLKLRRGKTATTLSTRAWRKPPIPHLDDPSTKVETFNCIHDARPIPGTRQILVELWHECLTSGDWCSLGGPTWHVISAP